MCQKGSLNLQRRAVCNIGPSEIDDTRLIKSYIVGGSLFFRGKGGRGEAHYPRFPVASRVDGK